MVLTTEARKLLKLFDELERGINACIEDSGRELSGMIDGNSRADRPEK
jgi:hypothetical protein